jgi:hypothetical protein
MSGVVRGGLGALVALLGAGCTLLVDVERCRRDGACGEGRVCVSGTCRSVSIDAPDAALAPDAGSQPPPQTATPLPDGCEVTDLVDGALVEVESRGRRFASVRSALAFEGLADLPGAVDADAPFTLTARARLVVSNVATYEFSSITSGRSTLFVDGVEFVRGDGAATGALRLETGLHALLWTVEVEDGVDFSARLDGGLPGRAQAVLEPPAIKSQSACDGRRSPCEDEEDQALFNVGASLEHCAACGAVCSSLNSEATCERGECAFACAPGYIDADDDPATGCETRVLEGAVCGVYAFLGEVVRIGDAEVCGTTGEAGGTFEVTARHLEVVGRIDASGRGWPGGGGGGGGAGAEVCAGRCVAAARAASGGRGGAAPDEAEAGLDGEGAQCVMNRAAAGDGGAGGRGGGEFGGVGGDGASAWTGDAGRGGDEGERGGYAGPRANVDASSDLDVLRGGGGGGGGGAGGLGRSICCGQRGGLGGGAGGAGGGRVVLRATEKLVLGPRARLDTYGRAAEVTTSGSSVGGGGDGRSSDPDRPSAPESVSTIGPECEDPAPSLRMPPRGGQGGAGAGGGVLLVAPALELEGEVDARGGGGVQSADGNGGTVKLAHCGAPLDLDALPIQASRVLELRAPNCPP